MSKLINAQLNLDKIDKNMLFQGKKGTYLNLTIWVNEKPDDFGNDVSIQQTFLTDKEKQEYFKKYIGQGKQVNK